MEVDRMVAEPLKQKAAYSIAEFCELVSLGRSRVFEEIRDKRLRIVKVGRRTLIPALEVTAWLERLAAQSPVQA
jgi:excisionase family DNA binding protein